MRWGLRKYMETNQGLPESQSEISAELKTGRTPVNRLIHREFLRSLSDTEACFPVGLKRARDACMCVNYYIMWKDTTGYIVCSIKSSFCSKL